MAADIQHSDRAHSSLTASGAHRWLNCPASVALEANEPNRESEVAREGTAAHELAEYKLRKRFHMKTGKRPASEYEDVAMDDYTDAYADYIDGIVKSLNKPNIFIEQRVEYSDYAPGGFGTADCILLDSDQLHIIDLKYGKGVLVLPDDNPQLKLYALGALSMLDFPDVSSVHLHIFQPRRDNVCSWETTVDYLKNFGEYVKPIAEEALAGSDKQCAGPWCTFCKAQAKCRAHAAEVFDVIDAAEKHENPAELSDEEIDEMLPKLDIVEKWVKAVMAYAQMRAENGYRWASFKLVQARSNRKYTDEVAVAKRLESMGYTDIYNKKLLGIGDMEKLLGKKVFNEALSDLVFKPEGGPTLVNRATDRREEIQVEPDFKSLD